VREEYEDQEYSPTRECTNTAGKTTMVKEEGYRQRPDNLSNPVHEIVQATCADVEEGAVVVIEFCNVRSNYRRGIQGERLTPGGKPVGSEEHREE